MTKKRARRLAAELPVKGDFKDFGAMSAVSAVLPADRGSLTVTVGDTQYRTECRYKTDTAKRCQVLLLLFQAGSKWAKEREGGKKMPDLPNLELLFSCRPCLEAPRGRKDRKDIDRFVDCNRKRALSVTCCAGSVCL